MKKAIFFSLSFLVALTCLAQQTITVTKLRPAEIDFRKYKRIAIGDFVNPYLNTTRHSMDFSEYITSRLLTNSHFSVIDKPEIERILVNQKSQELKTLNESTASLVGKKIGSALIVLGRIQADEFSQELVSKKVVMAVDNCNTKYWHKATGNYVVSIKVFDAATGELLIAKPIGSRVVKNSKEVYCGTPPVVDLDVVYTECINNVIDEFMSLLADHEETIKIEFESDVKFKQLKNAVTLIQVDEKQEALEILKGYADDDLLKPNSKAKALYNYGMVLLYYFNRYDEANRGTKTKRAQIN